MSAEEALRLIGRSISHDEIVTTDHTDALDEALSIESDDSAETESSFEYWGTDEDGNEWRVHLAKGNP